MRRRRSSDTSTRTASQVSGEILVSGCSLSFHFVLFVVASVRHAGLLVQSGILNSEPSPPERLLVSDRLRTHRVASSLAHSAGDHLHNDTQPPSS